MKRLAIAVALAGALLLASCGNDGPSSQQVEIKGKRRSGRHAVAIAKGFVDRPVSVSIRVSAAPPQRVYVSWGLSCSKSDAGSGKHDETTSGVYRTTPPNVRALRLPGGEFAVCAVNAQAQLSGSGRVKVAILGNRG